MTLTAPALPVGLAVVPTVVPALPPESPSPATTRSVMTGPKQLGEDAETGWCVRLDWRDGQHDLGKWHATQEAADRDARKAYRYWSGSPGNVLASCTVVPANHTVCQTHPRTGCRSETCPR